MSEPAVNRTWPARLASGLRDGWLIFGICLAMLLVVDAVLRELVGGDGAGPDRRSASFFQGMDWTEAYWQEHKTAKQMHWKPYVYWRRVAHAGSQINVGEDGLRRTVLPVAADAPLPEVWVFGGSSVWGTGVPDDLTLPSLLAAELGERGAYYRVVNFGESGYVSTQSLINLALALRNRPAPQLAVFVEGANDVFAAYQTGIAGTPQNEFRRRAEFRSSDGLDNYLAAFPQVLDGVMTLVARTPEWQTEALASDVAKVMESNRQQVMALAQHYRFSALHIWQPTVFEISDPSAFEQEVIAATDPLHRQLHRASRAAVSRFECFRNIDDAVSVLPEDRFMDFVHPGPSVNHVMAEHIAAMILSNPDCLPVSDSLADTPPG